ncbi:MAG TPA: homocysteine S-methyltransferase family protein [Acidimicrobiales bacterium]|nr:homocysteine S-methyltransferase family protein [Acidimicrobiales bacterium]
MPGPALTDTGLETVLVFRHGMDLPDFASFPLLDDPHGRELIAAYYRDHLRIAAELGAAIVLETPTWRANPDWGARQGYDHEALDRINQDAVAFVRGVADEFADVPVTVSGNLGPRGDAYAPEDVPTAEDSQRYHEAQIASFVAAGADRVTVLTITHAAEAVGIVRAAAAAEIPVVVSFTTETDGRLPSGQGLLDAVAEVDAATGAAALFYGINCAHPDHFSSALHAGDARTARIQLLRANASRMSHAELDESEELDDGDPDELAGQYRALLEAHPHLQILGGCCGTDPRHLHAIGRSCV